MSVSVVPNNEAVSKSGFQSPQSKKIRKDHSHISVLSTLTRT